MIGIISDGDSDFDVLKKLVQAIFEKHSQKNISDEEFYRFDKIKTFDAMQSYFDDCRKKQKGYGLHDFHTKEFIKNIIEFLVTSFYKLTQEKETPINNQDIIIFNADSEMIMGKNTAYFEEWLYFIHPVLWKAIEHFYDKLVLAGYSYEQIPLVLPIIPFPCIEILVRAAMPNYDEKYRNLKAKPELKQEVWGVDTIPTAYKNGYIAMTLEDYIIPQNIEMIYKHIPEARKFIQILSFNLK
ncbi:hypothetical protein [Bernardetia sp. MNP-M8]|uniref:hypothetical protein n=1 Tax=Bernardetia sp. MNP-M8 TaxID=3127470 RepID=UPI0030CF8C0F